MHDGEAIPPQIDEPIRMSYVGVYKAEVCWWPLRTYNPRQMYMTKARGASTVASSLHAPMTGGDNGKS